MSFDTFQKSGDVILTGISYNNIPELVFQTLPNLFFQTVLTLKVARYPHVLLCVLPGLYIHSTPKSGVDFLNAESPEADFPRLFGTRWNVFRNQRVSNEAAQRCLMLRTTFYVRQMYNWRFQGSPLFGLLYRTSHSFCSQLVAQVFADIGEPMKRGTSKGRSERVLPTHIERAVSRQRWKNVTEDYCQAFEQAKNSKPYASPVSIAVRALFVQEADLGALSAVARVKSRIQSDKVSDLFKQGRTIVENINGDELHTMQAEFGKIMKDLPYNPRSLRSETDFRLSVIFAADSALAQGPREPLHFSEELYKQQEPTWLQALVGAEDIARKNGKNLDAIGSIVLNYTEEILHTVSLIVQATRRYGASAQPDAFVEERERLKNNVKDLAAKCVDRIQIIEDFDNYDEEINNISEILRKSVAQQALRQLKTRALLRHIARELQCRLILAQVRNFLGHVAKDAENFDAAFESYNLAIQMVNFEKDL